MKCDRRLVGIVSRTFSFSLLSITGNIFAQCAHRVLGHCGEKLQACRNDFNSWIQGNITCGGLHTYLALFSLKAVKSVYILGEKLLTESDNH